MQIMTILEKNKIKQEKEEKDYYHFDDNLK